MIWLTNELGIHMKSKHDVSYKKQVKKIPKKAVFSEMSVNFPFSNPGRARRDSRSERTDRQTEGRDPYPEGATLNWQNPSTKDRDSKKITKRKMYDNERGLNARDYGEGAVVPRSLDELVGWLDLPGSDCGLGNGTDINHDIQHFTTIGSESKWPI